ncbi:MAG: phage tail protein [Prolixibacteraceae bacterium]
MSNYYPPVGFHFKVEVPALSSNGDDVRFTEVSGLSVEMKTEEVPEGGENRFAQKYPGGVRYTDITLKRGLLIQSELTDWIDRCINSFDIQPKEIFIKLLNENHDPLITWHLINAYPTKWSVSDLNSSNNAVVVESLQLTYQYFTVDK